MEQTPRQIVTRCLRFEHPQRLPRDLWLLPWAARRHRGAVEDMQRRFPSDFAGAPDVYVPSPRVCGDPYAEGAYVDEWGCRFTSIQAGVIGEVRQPQVTALEDWHLVQPPYETLPPDRAAARAAVNRFCAATDLFVRAPCCPRPWERYQFLRGSEEALIDVALGRAEMRQLLDRIHAFYLDELEFWAATDVDALMFMDDWGAQDRLLINPETWRRLFKPLYREYCRMAREHGKFAFMHSDGHIAAIYEDLIEVGVDAVNSQLFCMDLDDLARRAKGRITFWGEIDRQWVLADPDPAAGRRAVRRVAEKLYDPSGGIIAQFEFGAGAQPETSMAVWDEWRRVDEEARRRPGAVPI